MEKYIHLYENETNFNADYHGKNYLEPWVSLTEDIERVNYNKTEEEKEKDRLLGTPLTFEIQSNGNIIWKANSASTTARTIEYSKDNGETWTEITSASGDSAPSISVVSGDTVQFRGNNSSYSTLYYYNCFSGSTCSFSLKGNIMSLVNSTDFVNLKTLSGSYTFGYLFRYCTGLTDASNLVLPATTLTQSCYFYMFERCTSLTTAPELPATTLASNCYNQMFQNCTSLTTAPELPATTLANYCYQQMFQNCTSLNYIKCLATDISAEYCTLYWVYGVASTGTFECPASTNWSSKTGNNGIPSGWDRVNAS